MPQHGPMEAVYGSRTRDDCRTRGLVLEAAGIRYEVYAAAGEFTLVVAAPDAARARAELEAYAQENRDGPNDGPTPSPRAGGWGGVLGYAAVLLLVALLERQGTFALDWFAAGKADAGLIREGQWWRALTALSLHVDLPHLVANLVIGGLIGLFAGQLLGSGLAWAGILFAGMMGNLLNARIRPPDHTSVGASTAVFAALGIVAAYAWTRRRHLHLSRLARWAPLVGGVVLLGYLGTGGERTDVAAHVTGFISGGLLGALYAKLGRRWVFTAKSQFFLGMGALAVLALAWALALATYALQSS